MFSAALSPKMALLALPLAHGFVLPRQNGPNLRVLPLGASITYGLGMEGSHENGYRGQLRQDLVDAGYTVNMVGYKGKGSMIDTGAEGHSGARVSQLEERAAYAMSSLKPNLVLINAGTNNCGQEDFRHPEGIRDEMESLMNLVWDDFLETSIFLSGLLPNGNDESAQACVEEVNGLYEELAAKKAGEGRTSIFVDTSEITTDDLFDGIHPNDDGYDKMGGIWSASILDALSNGAAIADPGPTFDDWVKPDGDEEVVCPSEVCDNIPPEPEL